jgi:glutathione S-transferase
MYKLYIIPGSCSTGIHTLINELDLNAEIIQRDEVDNYLAISPTNQVPALQADNTVLLEGAAIALHLIREHGEAGLTKDPDFIRWLMFNYATLHPAYGKLFAVNGAMEESPAKQALLQALGNKATELWDIVNQHMADQQLAGKQYMHGNKPSIIDYLLAVYVHWGNVFPQTEIKLGDNVVALVNRVLALPQFQQTLDSEDVQYHIPENALAA